MSGPRRPDGSARDGTLILGPTSSGALTAVSDADSVRSANYSVGVPPPFSAALSALCAISVLASIAVPITKIRTERLVSTQRPEAWASRIKRIAPTKAATCGILGDAYAVAARQNAALPAALVATHYPSRQGGPPSQVSRLGWRSPGAQPSLRKDPLSNDHTRAIGVKAGQPRARTRTGDEPDRERQQQNPRKGQVDRCLQRRRLWTSQKLALQCR
jgi:hypothetical protein